MIKYAAGAISDLFRRSIHIALATSTTTAVRVFQAARTTATDIKVYLANTLAKLHEILILIFSIYTYMCIYIRIRILLNGIELKSLSKVWITINQRR